VELNILLKSHNIRDLFNANCPNQRNKATRENCRCDLHAYSMHKSPNYIARRPNDAFSFAWSWICHGLIRASAPRDLSRRDCLFKILFFHGDALLRPSAFYRARAFNNWNNAIRGAKPFLNSIICLASGLLSFSNSLFRKSLNLSSALGTYSIFFNRCRNETVEIVWERRVTAALEGC